MELTNTIKSSIKNHALKDPDKEACGIILSNGEVVKCKNRADDSDIHFIINSGDIKKAQKRGQIQAIYHSHIKIKDEDDGLSSEDKVISEYFNVVFVLYSLIRDEFYIYIPTGKPVGYIGRPYVRNVLDEIQLIEDYYKRELNIPITKIKNKNIELLLKSNNFNEVSLPDKHDIIIVNWQKDKNQKRALIYLGKNKILTQPEFDLSKIIDYNYGIKKWTQKVFRHEKLM